MFLLIIEEDTKKSDNFTEVIDFTNLENNTPENRKLIQHVELPDQPECQYHQKIQNIYRLSNHEGT